MKAVIDDHIQRLFDALLNSLRRSITKDVGTIETFLNDAMDTLSQRPQTVEEIGEANAKHSEFGKSKKEVSGPGLCQDINKQECVPIGYIPTAAVAATRCQYGGRVCLGGVCQEVWSA